MPKKKRATRALRPFWLRDRATSCCDGVQRGKAADTDLAFLPAGKRRKMAAEAVASAARLEAPCFMVNKIEASSD